MQPVGYVSVMTSLITRAAVAEGIGVELLDIEQLDEIGSCHIDGAIGVVFDDRVVELSRYPNLPLVTINHPMVEHGIHSVYTDHYEQGALATRHLIENGHKRIGFLAIQPDEWGSAQRQQGYRSMLQQAGLPFDEDLVCYSNDAPAYDILRRWMSNGVTAILNFSEDAAAEVLHILSNVLSLRIGEDVSTITLENLPIYQYFSPPQTVVRQPLAELASLAVKAVVERSGRREPGASEPTLNHCLKGELIKRDSVVRLHG